MLFSEETSATKKYTNIQYIKECSKHVDKEDE